MYGWEEESRNRERDQGMERELRGWEDGRRRKDVFAEDVEPAEDAMEWEVKGWEWRDHSDRQVDE